MRVIPSRLHAVIDYATGILLLIVPYVLGFADGTAAQYVPQAIGAATIVMSLLTDYELSVAKLVPFPVHLGIDAATGIVLAASPWLFGFANRVAWPHVVVGVLEIAVVLLSRTHPDRAARLTTSDRRY